MFSIKEEFSGLLPPGRVLWLGAGHKRQATIGRRSSRDCLAALAPEACEQSRIPPLRSVIMNSDTQRLLLPDQDDQLLAPCDARVDQVPLQQLPLAFSF